MLRTVIIDDEVIGINTLKILIERYTKGLKVVAIATDPEKGIRVIKDYAPDVVFLDVSMPKMSGFELLEHVKEQRFKLIFTTAHDEFAIRAIKNGATDYLLKPIDVEELKECVGRLMAAASETTSNQKKSPSFVELAVKDGIIFIKANEIIRLEASGSYTFFYLDNNVKHIASKNLKECEALLDPSLFFRCHHSHIVNLSKVVKMVSTDGLFAQMVDGSMPEIVRKSKEAFLERLKKI